MNLSDVTKWYRSLGRFHRTVLVFFALLGLLAASVKLLPAEGIGGMPSPTFLKPSFPGSSFTLFFNNTTVLRGYEISSIFPKNTTEWVCLNHFKYMYETYNFSYTMNQSVSYDFLTDRCSMTYGAFNCTRRNETLCKKTWAVIGSEIYFLEIVPAA